MREIGSEFWDVPITQKQNNLFPKHTGWFLSGRSALQSIIRELPQNGSVSMPSWCCDSMVKPFIDAGMKVQFYPVYWQGEFIQDVDFECDVLFLMDYFGYTTTISDLSFYKGIIIRDVTQSIFSTTYSDADYYFGSLRKWCGVWTGGYAWSKDGHVLSIGVIEDQGFTVLREKAMQQKKAYITGHTDGCGKGIADKEYLKTFEDAEEILEYVNIVPAAERDIWMAQRLDIEFIKSRRRANSKVLRSALPDLLVFQEMAKADCPMFVPILVPDGQRDELRRYLIKNDVYCPVHWPLSEFHILSDKDKLLYANELSLVCDQRYIEEDMCRIVELINTFWKET